MTYLSPKGNNDATWPEFWGHSQVIAKELDGTTVLSSTVSGFHQTWPLVGRPFQVDVGDAAGSVFRSTVNTWSWTTDLGAWGNAAGWDFVHLDQVDVTQGAGHRRTTFTYDAGYQNGKQAGNQTEVKEYDLGQGTDWIRYTVRWFYPTMEADHHVVNRLAAENVQRNPTNAPGSDPGHSPPVLAPANPDGYSWDTAAWYLYDNSTRQDQALGTRANGDDGSYRGRLTRVRRLLFVDGVEKSVDTEYGYNDWGNRTSEATYAAYGDMAAQATGSYARQTTTAFDGTYNAFAISVKQGAQDATIALTTQYDYDYVLGRLKTETDPNGQQTWHAYDPLGRRTETWLPGDDHNQPGAATATYRYLVGGGAPTRVQVGRRKDAGGGAFGSRAYEWRFYDGLGRLIQTQRDLDRRVARIRAADVNDLWAALSARGQTPGFAQVVAGQDRVAAGHWTGLRDKVDALWNATVFGQALPAWSSGSPPAGPPNARPIYLSDLTDLRSWLNADELSRGRTLTTWTQLAATVAVMNRTYDARGLLKSETAPHALTLAVPGQYQAGDWASTAAPATAYAYDALRRRTTLTRPGGEQDGWVFDGWTTTHYNPRGLATDSTTDALGRLVRVAQMYANRTPAAVVDYRYDAADRLRLVFDGTCHDANGNLVVTKRGGTGNVTEVVYDQLGRKTDLYDPDLGHWAYRYDPVGTLNRQTDARGQMVDFAYDGLGRLLTKTDTTASPNVVLAQFVYGEAATGYYQKGRRTTSKWGAGLAEQTRSYYDARGRCVRADHTLGGTVYTVQTAYDEMDRVLGVVYPNGETVRYAYGDHGQPVALASSVWGQLVSGATYNPLSQPLDVALGNGLTVSRRYFGLDYSPPAPRNPLERYGMLRSLSAGTLQDLTYDYDPNGNVAGLVDQRNQGEALTFGYDHADRLLTASSSLLTEGYGYDDRTGTMTGKNGVGRGFPAAGQPRPHAPTSVGGQSYQYDGDGNLTSAEGRTYTYDPENRLISVGQGGAALRGFAYDADGALRLRTDGGVPARRYVTPDYHVELPSGQPVVHHRFGGATVAWAGAQGLRYVLGDHLGSDAGEATQAGAEAGQSRYSPFGSSRSVSGAGGVADEERYTGQRRADDGGGNPDLELYHYGARAYLPGIGIFTQPDSVVPDPGRPDALNRYAYCLGNPLKYADPTGHWPNLGGLGDALAGGGGSPGVGAVAGGAFGGAAGGGPAPGAGAFAGRDLGGPDGWDPGWVAAFAAAHPGQGATAQDWADYQFSLQYPGNGAGGGWTSADWATYQEIREVLGPRLLAQVGQSGGPSMWADAALGTMLFRNTRSFPPSAAGPDGTTIYFNSRVVSGAGATTIGNSIFISPGEMGRLRNSSLANAKALIAHEYTHVLQYRAEGATYLPGYAVAASAARSSGHDPGSPFNTDELPAYTIQNIYEQNPWLPGPWAFPVVR